MTNPEILLEQADALAVADVLRDHDYTVDGINARLGLAVAAALSRSDLAAVERATRDGDPLATLIRLFVLGQDVPQTAAHTAFGARPYGALQTAGIISEVGTFARARIDIRPYSEADDVLPGQERDRGSDWWVVSDFGAEVRAGALGADHVLGIGAAATTLAQATVRAPVGRVLDLGTGCGIQALHLSKHAQTVVGTDLSVRALHMAAATAALNGMSWDLRQGDLLEPVHGERFDQIVANPPFVVGPAVSGDDGGFDYRDSGLAGDEVSRRLVSNLGAYLNPGGTAQLLANWVVTADQDWTERLTGWIEGTGCDAWVWQREVADPSEYVSLWLRDAAIPAGTLAYTEAYDGWLRWFEDNGVLAVGMGLVSLRRTERSSAVVVCEDVAQAVVQPAGPHIADWFDRADWLAHRDDAALLNSTVNAASDLVLSTDAVISADGWQEASARLRTLTGMRWEVDTDSAIAAAVAGCQTGTPLHEVLAVLAYALQSPVEAVHAGALPVLRDLVARGLLLPAG